MVGRWSLGVRLWVMVVGHRVVGRCSLGVGRPLNVEIPATVDEERDGEINWSRKS